VIAFALEISNSKRNDVLSLGDFALGVVEHLALEENDGIVVANRGL
jgi:hypothetical protein